MFCGLQRLAGTHGLGGVGVLGLEADKFVLRVLDVALCLEPLLGLQAVDGDAGLGEGVDEEVARVHVGWALHAQRVEVRQQVRARAVVDDGRVAQADDVVELIEQAGRRLLQRGDHRG